VSSVRTDVAMVLPATTIEPRWRSYSSASTRVLAGSSRSSVERTTWM
jgi:hypothetical protein